MEDITNLPKRKYAKDNAVAVKRRNDARTERKPAGTINFTADTKQEIEKFKPYLIVSNRFWEKENVVLCLQKLHWKKCCSFSLQETLNWPPIMFKVKPFTSLIVHFPRVRKSQQVNNNCLSVLRLLWTN